MTRAGPKADLHRYLQAAREALLWKLDGLSEYDIRRPLTPTGTNLLGLVKHLAGVELWYFADAFGRPPSGPRPWSEDDARNNADMWATADESREQIVGMYRQAWAHANETIQARDLDAPGHVPWWPSDRSEVTLHQILVHWSPRPTGTPGTPISSANSSTGPPDCRPTTTTSGQLTRRGGRTTATSLSASRKKPARAKHFLDRAGWRR
jgi:hypothetical protein